MDDDSCSARARATLLNVMAERMQRCCSHLIEQKKGWMMLKKMFDRNQTSFNNFQHDTTWWPNECNMFDSTMWDDVTLTCSVDPFGQALTARNVIVDESTKKKKTLPFEAPTQCHSSVSPVLQFPVIFFKDML